jgi:hypothetical protein
MTEHESALSDERLERLADLVATKMAGMRPAGRQLLTVEDVSVTFRVSRAWVYENAGRLGGFKLGPGDRAPLRFDPDVVAAALRPVGEPSPQSTPTMTDRQPHRRRPRRLLPVYDG